MQAFGFSYRLANKYLFIVVYGDKSATSKHCFAFLHLLKIYLVIEQAYVQLHQQTLGGCYLASYECNSESFHELLLGDRLKFDSLVNVELCCRAVVGSYETGLLQQHYVIASLCAVQFFQQAFVQSWHPHAKSQVL